MNYEGKVAEISGLKGGSNQYVEDALVPEVMQKVMALPGGEKYLQAFDDKQRLIALDRKVQSDSPFTVEDLEFIYELQGKIQYIDTYNADPRPNEFRRRSGNREILAQKYSEISLEVLFDMSPYDIEQRLKDLAARGVEPGVILSRLDGDQVARTIRSLAEIGVDGNEIMRSLKPVAIFRNRTILAELEVLS